MSQGPPQAGILIAVSTTITFFLPEMLIDSSFAWWPERPCLIFRAKEQAGALFEQKLWEWHMTVVGK